MIVGRGHAHAVARRAQYAAIVPIADGEGVPSPYDSAFGGGRFVNRPYGGWGIYRGIAAPVCALARNDSVTGLCPRNDGFFGLPPVSLCSSTPLVNEGGEGRETRPLQYRSIAAGDTSILHSA